MATIQELTATIQTMDNMITSLTTVRHGNRRQALIERLASARADLLLGLAASDRETKTQLVDWMAQRTTGARSSVIEYLAV